MAQTYASAATDARKVSPRSSARRGQSGYALVSLLAVMTIMALLLISAAPSVRHQMQRTLEDEAIWRGEQVAEAIRLFARSRNGQLPTSMEQLLEGNPSGTKKVQILRPVAAVDPLSSSGEWKLIRPNDPAFIKFQAAVTIYAGGITPQTREPALARYQVRVTNAIDTGSSEEAPGGEDNTSNTSGPFIGVASRSRRGSIITYYGIERHDQWIFTPLFR